MLYDVLSFLHAATGAIAFIAGVVALDGKKAAYRVFFLNLIASMLFMVAAISDGWARLSDVAQVVYLALGVLGGYLLFRAGHAGNELSERYDEDWQDRYVSDIGFTLVGQGVGFVLVVAMDLRLPAWLVAVVTAASIAGGAEAFRLWRRQHALAH
jgi:hypothetical protein